MNHKKNLSAGIVKGYSDNKSALNHFSTRTVPFNTAIALEKAGDGYVIRTA